jgi:hypothetical protein
LRVAGGARTVFFKMRRLPVDRSRIPAPRSPGKSTRRMCAYGSSSHSASPSSSSLLSAPGSSSVRWSGGHLFFFLLQSSHRRFFGPRFITPMLRPCGPKEKSGGRALGDGREGPRQVHLDEWGGAQPSTGRGGAGPLAPAVPRRGTPRKKWPVSLGYRGLLLGPLDGAWGRKNVPRDNGPPKFPPVFRSQSARGAAKQRGRKSNGKHPLKRQFTQWRQ